MYNVNPKAGETFFLRLLLLSVKGAQSFADLKTFDNKLYETLKDAASARGLLKTDDEWNNCLTEAALFQMPRQLRQLYATICACCQPSHPISLYEQFKFQLMDDFSRNNTPQVAEQLCLQDIQRNLLEHSITCESLGLPTPTDHTSCEEVFDEECEKAAGEVCRAKLNAAQVSMVDAVLHAIDTKSASNVFILDGPGGTGRTSVYSSLMHVIRGRNIHVISVSSTGIAATLLRGGRTAHSRFGLPVPLTKGCTSKIMPASSEAEELRKAVLFLWDEGPMAPSYALECLDKLLQDVMGNTLPFRGKVVLLGGDFRQVLPVFPRASRATIMACSIKRSTIWAKVRVFKLTQNMRAGENEHHFSSWLLQLGNGTLPVNENITPNSIQLPSERVIIRTNIVDAIYGTSINTTDLIKFAGSAILCPKNQECREINDEVLRRLPGNISTYRSVDCVTSDCSEEEANNYPPEFLHTLNPSGFPPHELRLKPSAVIMLLRNLNPKKGLCNGTRLIVRRLHQHTIDAEILTGDCKGDRVLIPRIEIAPTDTGLPIKLSRQFPVRLSFAMTINKSQGQTFDKIGIFLQDCVFSHGQLYVAFSRVRRLQDVKVFVNNTNNQGQLRDCLGTFTDNVVYQDAF